ncbi:MAG: fluoride efflux transporter CrcB [Thermogemmatispora sp.]|uniref:fluoride efflux transporter CrcB n=1 Tax=Thermogemmatispora sp. TaxID=1968838 RepID=UPI002602A911|nr:fluoride efflux transporter CrcB [Thermogemmatispora sp.]MBX5457666.1 fluoride efflux transporter CrcB [Thermogemmatispora sp.]
MTLAVFGQLVTTGLAGALGALSRYVLGRFIAERVATAFPLGTLVINLTGAFAIGLVFGLAAEHVISTALQSVLATGFLGGYTTFSTMSWEGVELLRGGSGWLGLLYLVGSVLLGLLAAALGLAVGRWL